MSSHKDNRAIKELGRCYDEGIGVEPNPSKAFRLYKKALTQKGQIKFGFSLV